MKKQDKENYQKITNHVNMAFFILMAFCLSACGDAPLALLDKMQTGVQNIKDSSYDAAARSIERYCDKVPLSQRLKLRQNINARTQNGDIIITCDKR